MWILSLVGCRTLLFGPDVELPPRWDQVKQHAAVERCGAPVDRFETRAELIAWHAQDPRALSRLQSLSLFTLFDEGTEPISSAELPALVHALESVEHCGALVDNMVAIELNSRLCVTHGASWATHLNPALPPATNQAIAAREALAVRELAAEPLEGGGVAAAALNDLSQDMESWVLDVSHENELGAPPTIDDPIRVVSKTMFSGIQSVLPDYNAQRAEYLACRTQARSQLD